MFRQDCTCPALLEDCRSGFPYGAVTRYGSPFQTLPVPKTHATGLVRFRSPLLTESRLMSFPPATEMFQFAGFASRPYEFRTGYPQGSPPTGGLPHSEIPRSPIARISPGLFAACRVLPRLSVPRHPPDALILRFRASPPRTAVSPEPGDPSGSPDQRRPWARFDTLRGGPTRHRRPGLPPRSLTQLPLHPSINNPPTTRPRPGRRTWWRRLVEVNGLEPMTSCLQSRRSPD